MDEFRQGMIALLPRLRRFAYALTRDLEQADDLVQDACARALANRDKWQAGTRLDSWMYRIAQNIWLDRRRSPRLRQETPLDDEVVNMPGSDGRVVTEERLTLAAVGKCLDRLSAEQQVLVAMVCVDGLSYKEAASALGIPIGTVMSRLAAARQALYRIMGAEQSHTTARRER
jgi:RNA polymerase sigma-70 factor (ECF subfamily)